ncbi:hypothetical protein CN372_04895 [Bacillus anthracis]|nr:hypothetical protein CN372_04895 [Bacillus anthracis]
MKIEVGDKIRNEATGSLGIVTEVKGLNVDFKRCIDDKECITTVNYVTVIEKGEKEMKYEGIEAYKALQDGKILELGAASKQLYKMMGAEGDTLYTKRKNEDAWSYCNMELNFFMSREFTEYKEPLKYKVGDKVWVKAIVINAREDSNTPYSVRPLRDYAENEVKGIDE